MCDRIGRWSCISFYINDSKFLVLVQELSLFMSINFYMYLQMQKLLITHTVTAWPIRMQ